MWKLSRNPVLVLTHHSFITSFVSWYFILSLHIFSSSFPHQTWTSMSLWAFIDLRDALAENSCAITTMTTTAMAEDEEQDAQCAALRSVHFNVIQCREEGCTHRGSRPGTGSFNPHQTARTPSVPAVSLSDLLDTRTRWELDEMDPF